MTQDKAKKKAARDRMARTGEPYTVAKRAVEAQHQAHGPGPDETSNSMQALASELARKAEIAPTEGRQLYDTVQQYAAGAGVPEVELRAVARRLREAMDLGMAEVIATVRNLVPEEAAATLSGEGTLVGGRRILAGASLSGEGTLIAGAHVMAKAGAAVARGVASGVNVITLSDEESIQPHNLNRLLARAAQDGVAGLSTVQILALVLVCLLTVGAPFAQLALPPEAQALLTEEYSTLSLGLAIALAIVTSRKR